MSCAGTIAAMRAERSSPTSCCQTANISTLATISSTVMIGRRCVGSLVLRGNTAPDDPPDRAA